jgi:hypothetical protein
VEYGRIALKSALLLPGIYLAKLTVNNREAMVRLTLLK